MGEALGRPGPRARLSDLPVHVQVPLALSLGSANLLELEYAQISVGLGC